MLEALDQKGLLARLLPEWAAVRSRPQRNAYHRFTVDRHLCEAAADAAALTGRVAPARPPAGRHLAARHRQGLPRAGRPQPSAGSSWWAGSATRMGFPPDDVAVLVTLVRHHLLLADVATRRDVDDPATVETVAAAVGDRARSSCSHALTEADSLATGPAAWSAWKAGLVAELVEPHRRRSLAGRAAPGRRRGVPRPTGTSTWSTAARTAGDAGRATATGRT